MKAKTKSVKSKAAPARTPSEGSSKASSKRSSKAPARILVIDIGGSHVKFRIGARAKTVKFDFCEDDLELNFE